MGTLASGISREAKNFILKICREQRIYPCDLQNNDINYSKANKFLENWINTLKKWVIIEKTEEFIHDQDIHVFRCDGRGWMNDGRGWMNVD